MKNTEYKRILLFEEFDPFGEEDWDEKEIIIDNPEDYIYIRYNSLIDINPPIRRGGITFGREPNETDVIQRVTDINPQFDDPDDTYYLIRTKYLTVAADFVINELENLLEDDIHISTNYMIINTKSKKRDLILDLLKISLNDFFNKKKKDFEDNIEKYNTQISSGSVWDYNEWDYEYVRRRKSSTIKNLDKLKDSDTYIDLLLDDVEKLMI